MLRRLAFAVGLAFGLSVFAAGAADLSVSPTRLVVTPAEKVGSFVVRNADTKAVAMQVEVMSWTQTNAGDNYNPTRELLANPPLFELAPGAEQTIRVGVQVGETLNERAYRLFLQEVPLKDAPPTKDALLRIGIPVFVPPVKGMHELQWKLDPEPAGKLAVNVTNAGTAHAQILGLRILDDTGEVVVQEDIFAYLLAGQGRRWVVDTKKPVALLEKVHVEAATDAITMRSAIVIGARPEPKR